MKHTNTSAENHSKKKDIVLKQQRPRRPLLFAIVAAAVIAVAGGIFFIKAQPEANTPVGSITSAGAQTDATQISYPLSLFGDGKARHFEHKTAEGLDIRYFILKSSDGVVRAAFDACDVCWPAGKGYHQEGDAMVCNNCGRRFDSVLVNEVKGGCNPAPLKRTVQGDQLVILVQDILQGQTYFNFKGKA